MTKPAPLTAEPERPALRSAPLSQNELILLTASALVALLVHLHYCLSGFGEQDAARLASDAIHWHATREIFIAKVDYRLRTSPLYIHSLKLALDHGLRIASLPKLMNQVSVFFSSVCLVGLYLLFRRLSKPHIAAAATVIYAITPAFWLGSVYGMPTLPSLAFWVFATLAFARATDEPDFRSARFGGFMALSLIFASIAFALKADMALSGGALLAVLLFERRVRLSLLACAGAIVVAATVLASLYAKWLATPVAEAVDPNSPNTLVGFLDSWSTRFPFRWSLLVDPKNNAPITHASGTLLFGVIVLALVYALVSGGPRARLALGLALWGLAPMLFWGLKSGNSARHNLPAFAPLCLLAASFLFELAQQEVRRAWLLIGSLTVIGWLDTSGPSSVVPSVNLPETTRTVEAWTSDMHRRGREFMAGPNPKKAILDSEYLIAYSEFEVWAAANAPTARAQPRAVLDGPQRETRVFQVGSQRAARALAEKLRRDGWDVFSVQFSL